MLDQRKPSGGGLLSELVSRRGLLTAAAGALLTSFYATYRVAVVPMLTPAELVSGSRGPAVPHENRVRPARNAEMAARHLPQAAWAADAKYQIRTESAYVYFEEWEPADSDEAVRFAPFAMIFLQKGKQEDEPPITVVAESAYARFASRFQIENPNPGRVIYGVLEGDVRIEGPDGLMVEGRTFTFSEQAMRIWSNSPVRFAHGPHRGQAVGLQLDLVPDEEARARDKLAVAGIKNVRLRRKVQMDLEFQDQPAASPNGETAQPAGDSEDAGAAKEPRIVKVRSAGSFHYVVAEHTATFEELVRVYHPSEGGTYDYLECDLLTLLFEPEGSPAPGPHPPAGPPGKAGQRGGKGAAAGPRGPGKAAPPRARPAVAARPAPAERPARSGDGDPEERFQSIGGNLAFRRLQADGSNVVLFSAANDLTANMQQLVYDARTRVAALTSRTQVKVVQGASEMHCPEITLVHEPEGTVSSVWCRGKGWLRHVDPEDGTVQLAAQWTRHLRKYPDSRSAFEVIELKEEALVRRPEQQMGLAADFIRLWLAPQPRAAPSPARRPSSPPADADGREATAAAEPGAAAPSRRESGAAGAAERVRPRRLLALENVAIVSPELQGETKRLEVWFEQPAGAGAKGARGARGPAGGRDGVSPPDDPHTNQKPRHALEPAIHRAPTASTDGRPPAAGGTERAAVDASQGAAADPAPANPDPANTDRPEPAPRRPTEPFEVTADLIRVRVIDEEIDEEARVAEVWAEGNAEIIQRHAGDDEEPLQVTGDRLHLENRAELDQVLSVHGEAGPAARPAHIRDRGMHIEGMDIHFDRQRNFAAVEGAGLLQVPVRQTLEGEPLTIPRLLDVWWKERMTFDGAAARFYGDVRAVVDDGTLRCQEMDVFLSQPVSFTETERSRQENVEIETVVCRDGVEFDTARYEENRLIELRRGRFSELSLNQITGRTEARGPGWIQSWQRGRGRRAALSPSVTVQANKPAEPDTAEWEYARIDFAGVSKGNARQKFTAFHDRVRIVYGPVERPHATIDLDHLPRDAGWLQCHALEVSQQEDGERAWTELTGRGNAELEGRTANGTFYAQADEIKYDESKGLYVLRALGSAKAKISRSIQPGRQPDTQFAQSFLFIPSQNFVKADRVTKLDLVQ